MRDYDFAKFLKTLETLSFHEARSKAQLEHKAAEGFVGLESRKPTKNQDCRAGQYENQLKDLLFWFNSRIKPYGLSDEDFLLIKTLCANLVNKGQLEESALSAFETVEEKISNEKHS